MKERWRYFCGLLQCLRQSMPVSQERLVPGHEPRLGRHNLRTAWVEQRTLRLAHITRCSLNITNEVDETLPGGTTKETVRHCRMGHSEILNQNSTGIPMRSIYIVCVYFLVMGLISMRLRLLDTLRQWQTKGVLVGWTCTKSAPTIIFR